ncbi:MAG: aminopeptidase P N-terminal domain-containing protein, partial [Comamonas sp.]
MTSVYAQRRARLAAQLGAGGVAIIPTAPELHRNRDTEYLYRHDSYFYYLTGFSEPNACLVLTSDGKSVLFCQPKDLEREVWTGYRLGPEAAKAKLAVEQAFSSDEINARLPRLLENRERVWFPFATHKGLAEQIEGWLGQVRGRSRFGVLCPTQQGDACALIDEMRLIKDAHELDIMRRASEISARAHVRAMQRSARMIRNGEEVREYHLDAELLHEFRQHGSQYVAYGSIVAAGANACVLHYQADKAPVRPGELVLIDAGCELDGYASDITRTYAAAGHDEFQSFIDAVDAAQLKMCAAVRAGFDYKQLHVDAHLSLMGILKDFGVITVSPEAALATGVSAAFFPHGIGHLI